MTKPRVSPAKVAVARQSFVAVTNQKRSAEGKARPAVVRTLLAEHAHIRRLLEVFGELTEKIDGLKVKESPAELGVLQDVMRYLTAVCDSRHQAVEDQIVDLMNRRRLDADPAIALIAHAHESLHQDGLSLQRRVERLRSKGRRIGPDLRQAALRYSAAYLSHLEQEESLLFPTALSVLNRADWENLATMVETDPLFGNNAADEYLNLFEFLKNRVVHVGGDRSGLSLMWHVATLGEYIEVLSSGLSDMGALFKQQTRAQYTVQQDAVGKLLEMRHPCSVFKLLTDATGSTLRAIRNAAGEAANIAVTTSKALAAPYDFHHSAFDDEPAQRLSSMRRAAAEIAIKYKHSWQAQMISLPLRIGVKKLMKDGEIGQMRAWVERANRIASVVSGIKDERVIKFGKARAEWLLPKLRSTSRVLLYLPGGAFVIPPTAMHRAMVTKICESINARALMVHYRLAPEHPFPAGLDDCVAAYRELLKRGVSADSIVIAGDSAGGGLVLSTLLALRDAGDPLPAASVVLSPLADLTFSGKSRDYNRMRDPMLPSQRHVDFQAIYLNNAHSPEDPLVSPIYGDFTGLSPCLIQVGSTEILLEDSLRMAARARAQGVDVKVEVWHEVPHVWHFMSFLPESGQAIAHIASFVREHVPLMAEEKAA